MKKLMLAALVGGLTATAPLRAAPSFALSPPGVLPGAPGSTVGWGFTVGADPTYWVTVSGVALLDETNPGLGVFTDLISPQGGPDSGLLPPGSPDWAQSFDPAHLTGFGSYAISPLSGLGEANAGRFLILYELYSDNPLTCAACFVDSGFATAPFSIQAAAAPEPAAGALTAAGAIALAALARLRRRSR